MGRIVFFVSILFGQLLFSQVVEEPIDEGMKPQNRLFIGGRSYPIFLNNEEHSAFLIRYTISERLKLDLNGFYDTYLMTNRVRTNLKPKWYVNDNLYLFSGMEIEMEANKYAQLRPMPPRVGLISGVGYDINGNLTIEAKSNIQMNSSPMGAYGEYLVPMPQIYTLGGKLKF